MHNGYNKPRSLSDVNKHIDYSKTVINKDRSKIFTDLDGNIVYYNVKEYLDFSDYKIVQVDNVHVMNGVYSHDSVLANEGTSGLKNGTLP